MIVFPGDPDEPEPDPEPPVIDGESIYDGCGDSKTCFGFPRGCLGSYDCNIFTAVRYEGEKFLFELLSSSQFACSSFFLGISNLFLSVGAAYISMGLSDDNRMGRDSVIECVRESQVEVFTSFTSVAGVDGSPRIPVK